MNIGSRIESLFTTPERRRMLRESAWVFAGQMGAALAVLIGGRILTELVLPADYGLANLIGVALMLFRQVFIGPFGNSQVRHHPEYAQAGLGNWYTREIGRMSWHGAGVSVLAASIAFFAWSFFARNGIFAGTMRWGLLAAILALLALETPKNVRMSRLGAERCQARYAAWSIAEAWFITLASIGLVYIWSATEALIAGQAVGIFLALLVVGIGLAPNWPPDTAQPAPGARAAVLKKSLDYGLPYVPVVILAWLATLSDRFVLEHFKSVADVGLYSAASGIASKPLLMVAAFLAILMRPIVFSAASESNDAKARRVFLLWMLVAVVVSALACLAFSAGGEWLASILLGKKFRAGADSIMFWVSLGFGLTCITQPMEVRLLSFGQSGRLILPQLVGAAGTLGLAFVLVPRSGALGAAQARGAACLLQGIATLAALLLARPGTPGEPIVQLKADELG